MTGISLCVVVFLIAFFAGRRSLVSGLAVVLVVGYAYGLTRANLQDPATYLMFDAAVVGLYLSELWRPLPRVERAAFAGISTNRATLPSISSAVGIPNHANSVGVTSSIDIERTA